MSAPAKPAGAMVAARATVAVVSATAAAGADAAFGSNVPGLPSALGRSAAVVAGTVATAAHDDIAVSSEPGVVVTGRWPGLPLVAGHAG